MKWDFKQEEAASEGRGEAANGQSQRGQRPSDEDGNEESMKVIRMEWL